MGSVGPVLWLVLGLDFGVKVSLKRSEERFRLMLWLLLGCAYKVP